jgi:predicted O-methyltransferase YrrM
MEVFEFGSGGSSIFLAGRAASVTCVEDEEKWAARVQDEAGKRGLHNLIMLHRPFDFHHPKGFPESDYLAALGAADFDVIVVDGKEESCPVRDACFWKAEEHIKPGGFIVLDDSWRYPQVKARNKALKWTDHKGTGYCRVGVTSTTVFAY